MFLILLHYLIYLNLRFFSVIIDLCEDIGNGLQLNSAVNKLNSSDVKNGSVVTIFEYRALEAATNNFNESNLLCQGESGSIYSARFSDKFLAIVKRLDDFDSDSAKQMEVIFVPWQIKIVRNIGFTI